MTERFHAARVKLRRAQKHIVDVTTEFQVASERHATFQRVASLSGVVELGLGIGIPRTEVVVEFPMPKADLDEVACCVGDAVHNLRAALDLLACEVVERSDGGSICRGFPFAESASALAGEARKRKFNCARADARDLHTALKPHGEVGGNKLLWGLHRLDIVDKHEDLLSITHDLPTPGLYISGFKGAVADEEPARLVFAQGDHFPGEEVRAVLEFIAIEVGDVIEQFDRLFA